MEYQVETAVSKADSSLGMLKKTFKIMEIKILRCLYVTYARPH